MVLSLSVLFGCLEYEQGFEVFFEYWTRWDGWLIRTQIIQSTPSLRIHSIFGRVRSSFASLAAIDFVVVA